MDSERIENSAVNAIETEVLKYPRLCSHIQTADKIPSWQGKLDKHIYVQFLFRSCIAKPSRRPYLLC